MTNLNSYTQLLGTAFNKIPKEVLAAIAVSFASRGGDELDEAFQRIINEWHTLHNNGIVEQKPPSSLPKKFEQG